MKNRFLLIYVALISLSTSCATKSDRVTIDDSPVLQGMIDKKIADVVRDTPDINTDSLPVDNIDTFEGLIYLLNADCSFCVGQFLDFISYCNEEKTEMPVIAIVENGNISVVEYYMEQVNLKSTNDLTIVENRNKNITSEELDSYSGTVFHCKNGRLTGSVSFSMR